MCLVEKDGVIFWSQFTQVLDLSPKIGRSGHWEFKRKIQLRDRS